MKKILTTVCVLLVLLLLSSCCEKDYQLMQDEQEISSIEIVSLKYAISNSDEQKEISVCTVENISDFMKNFHEISWKFKSPPSRSYYLQNQTVIKIIYKNGEYELISPVGKKTFRYKEEGKLSGIFHGTKVLNDTQFSKLIAKYVANDNLKLEYNFLGQESSDISNIQIVELGEFDDNECIPEQQTLIEEIEDISGFLEKFAKLDCYLNVNNPTRVKDNSVVIKICYNGGYYELIGADGQSTSYYENNAFDGYRYFNKEQFSQLIEEYVGK